MTSQFPHPPLKPYIQLPYVPRPAPPGADPSYPWHGCSRLNEKFRLKDLNRHGYIDYNDPPIPVSPRSVEVDYDRKKYYLPATAHNEPIHPIFKPQNWPDLDAYQYEKLQPALRLALNILFEPSVMVFFAQYFREPRCPVNVHPRFTLEKGLMYRFGPGTPKPGNPISDDEMKMACQKLLDVQDRIVWGFRPLGGMFFAQTEYYDDNSGGPNHGLTNTLVTLSDEFSDVYWGTADSRQFPKAQNFDTTAAYFRTHYILAATISHELCHCIHYITHGKTEMEPFYEDHRISELGMAFEAAIWGDCWYIQGQNARLDADGNYMASITCPYGVSMAEWPAGLPDSMLGTGYAIATAAFRGAKSTQFFPMLTAEL